MAIALEATSQADQASATSLSWSHTCTGSDRCLYVHAWYEGNTALNIAATYNGVAMAQLSNFDQGNAVACAVFRLVAPAAGANTVVVDLGGVTRDLAGFGRSYTGVDQTTPDHNVNTADGVSTAPSVTVTSQTDDLVLDFLSVASTSTYTPGSGQTQEEYYEPVNFNARLCGSREPGAASVVMDATLGTSRRWATTGLSVIPAAGGAVALAGTITGSSQLSAGLAVTRSLAGAVAGSSTGSAALAVARGLSGSLAGSSTLAGALSMLRGLAGTLAGSSAASGTLAVLRHVAGTLAGISTLTGTLRVVGQVALAGTLVAVSTLTGALRVTRRLTGTLEGTSSVTGTLAVLRRLAGAVAGTSTGSGTLAVLRRLAGTVAGSSSLTGTLSMLRRLAGAVAGSSTLTAALTVASTIAAPLVTLATRARTLTVLTAPRGFVLRTARRLYTILSQERDS